MANMSFDGPTGYVQIVPFQSAYIAKRDFYILEVQKVEDVLTWVPVKTFPQVLLGDLASWASRGGRSEPRPRASPALRPGLLKRKGPRRRAAGAFLVSAGGSDSERRGAPKAPRRNSPQGLTWSAGCLPG